MSRTRSRPGSPLSAVWTVCLWAALGPCLAVSLSGCVTIEDVPPFQGVVDPARIEPEERRCWHTADRIDESLASSPALDDDLVLRRYLQGIMDRLYPEFAGQIQVRVLTTPVMNAFCTANGSVYVHSVILASCENEAQIATVLAHEGAHFTHRHVYRSMQTAKTLSATSLVISATGIPMAGELAGVSSMMGHSRDLEREADAEGFKRLVAAGYDPEQAAVPFERMLAWVDAQGVEAGPYFLSSHPALENRIENFEQLATQLGDAHGSITGEQLYDEQVRDVLLLAVEGLLEGARHEGVILMLEDERTRVRFPAYAAFYLGEAYRLRGAPGDEAASVAAYDDALQHAPDFAPTWQALGRYHYKRGQLALSRRMLSRYLALAPDAEDADYVTRLIERIDLAGDTP